MARKIEVEILGDSRSLERAFARSSRSASGFNRDIGRAGRGVLSVSGLFDGLGRSVAFASGAFLGGAGLTLAIKTSVEAASNLAEQTNKVDVVFGKSSRTVTEWGKTTAASIGIANDQALEAAGTFGNLFTTVGLLPKQNAELSRSLVILAADLASFNNADPSETLDAIRSGLIGEAEPLRRFGVLLSETRVQQEALRETGKKTTKALSDQDKLLARYALILKDTGPAQGDFGRTADGLANAQRGLSAEIRDTQAAIGTALLPTVRDLTVRLRDWLGDSKNQAKIQRTVNQIVKTSGQVFHALAVGFKVARIAAKPLIVTMESMIGTGQRLVSVFNAVKGAIGGIAGHLGLGGGPKKLGPGQSPIGENALGGGGITAAVAKARPTGTGRLGLKAKFAKLELRLAQAQLTAEERDDRKILTLEAKNLHEQLQRRKLSLKERTALTEQLVTVEGQITAIDKRGRERIEAQEKARREAARKAREAAKKAREAAKKAREHAALVLENRQFRALGLGPGGSVLAPTKAALKKELGNVSEALRGTFLDTNATRSVLVKIRKLMSGQLGALSADVRSTVKQMLDDLKNQLTEFDGFNLTKAEKRRRFLDKQLSGPVGGDKKRTQGGTVVVNQTIVAAPGESADALARRQHFRAKAAFSH